MTKPPTSPKPSAEQDDAPDELDAEATASAYAEQASELNQRLKELISDYSRLFLRHPQSVEASERLRVLGAIQIHPWRKKLAAQVAALERDSLRASGVELGKAANWWEQSWLESIPAIVRRCENDVVAVARDLIASLPASLRVQCPGYPPLPEDPEMEGWPALDAAAVAVASTIRREVEDWEGADDPDAIKIGRRALQAMGCKGARNLRLFRGKDDD